MLTKSGYVLFDKTFNVKSTNNTCIDSKFEKPTIQIFWEKKFGISDIFGLKCGGYQNVLL